MQPIRKDKTADELDAAVEETIALCDGDPRAAVKTLLIANLHLENELALAVVAGSNGFTRGHFRQVKR